MVVKMSRSLLMPSVYASLAFGVNTAYIHVNAKPAANRRAMNDATNYHEIAEIPNKRGGYLYVVVRNGELLIGGRVLDLDGAGQLQVAVDDAVTVMRKYQAARDA